MNYTGNYQLNQWEKTDRVLMEDFNTDNEKIDAALAEVRSADAYVKLAEVATLIQTSQIDLDVSTIDFSQYIKVELFVHSLSYVGGYSIQVNHIASGYFQASCSGGGSTEATKVSYLGTVNHPGDGLFCLYPPHPQGNIRATNWSISGLSSTVSYTGYQYMAPCTWNEVKTFNILGSNFPVGTKVVLYGIKA